MQQRDIHERIYRFVLEVIKLTNKLPLTISNNVIIKQVIRSVTSIGANAREAKETDYWLRLLRDTNINSELLFQSLIKEVDEIIRILSTIILNSKRNS